MGFKVGLVISILLVLLGFQNCSNGVQFSDGSGGDLIAKTDGPAGGAYIDDNNTEDTGQIDHSEDGENGENGENGEDTSNHDLSHNYVCILDGPGNSVKIGFVGGKLLAKNATVQDVCMSMAACNEIISQKFSVKGPAFRGFCPNKNPNVIEMSDANLQALVNAL